MGSRSDGWGLYGKPEDVREEIGKKRKRRTKKRVDGGRTKELKTKIKVEMKTK